MARSFLSTAQEKQLAAALTPQFQGSDQECLIRAADAVADMAADAAVATVADGFLSGSKTYDSTSIDAGASQTTTVTVTGASLGDFAVASLGVSAAGLVVTAYISAADTATVVLFNATGDAVDLASTTLRVLVTPA
jgi:hypothetical protein